MSKAETLISRLSASFDCRSLHEFSCPEELYEFASDLSITIPTVDMCGITSLVRFFLLEVERGEFCVDIDSRIGFEKLISLLEPGSLDGRKNPEGVPLYGVEKIRYRDACERLQSLTLEQCALLSEAFNVLREKGCSDEQELETLCNRLSAMASPTGRLDP